MRYTVVVENDESKWEDQTGLRYHFPKMYAGRLIPGTRLIHYKGRITNRAFAGERLSNEPHYFAFSIAGNHSADPASEKGDLFVEILDFKRFDRAVPIRVNGHTLERIPETRRKNFWRVGVRSASFEVFEAVGISAGLVIVKDRPGGARSAAVEADNLTSTFIEGGRKMVYSTRYERHPELRARAIAIHGLRCLACDVDMGDIYGDLGRGYVHVHHKRPLSMLEGATALDPMKDLVPLCPNCHCMIHRPKNTVLTVNELRGILGKSPIPAGE